MNTYTWDRANRLLSMGGTSYAYDGLGNRITATASGVTTRHLLDMQPGLTQVIASTTGANVTRTVHAPHGVFSQKDSSGNWEWLLNDGLGSVRGVVSNAGSVLEHRHFDPFGNLYAGTMTQTDFGFTGEQFDAAAGLLYLRARHYRPGIGSFVSRDPFEGMMARPMSRNGYSWVEGRVADGRDPSGMCVTTSNPLTTLSRYVCSTSVSVLARRQGTPGWSCCGPDVTDWFYREIQNHYAYARNISSALDNELSPHSWFPPRALEIQRLFYDQFIAPYALSIDYGYVNYIGLSGSSGPYGCTGNTDQEQDQVISLCGSCINSTDIGNLMYGIVLQASGVPDIISVGGAMGFNFNAGEFLEALKSDVPLSFVGTLFPFISSIVGSSSSNFCNALASAGFNNYRSEIRSGYNCGPVTYACNSHAGEPNLDMAVNSEPNYNRFVSETVTRFGMIDPTFPRANSPVERWNALKAGGLNQANSLIGELRQRLIDIVSP